MTRYSRVAPGHGAAGHLQVPADSVLLVYHVVAGRQLERVDAAAAPGRHPRRVPRADPLAGQVAFGQHREPGARPAEAVADQAGGDVRTPGSGGFVQVGEAGAEPLAAQQLGQPLGRAVPFGDQGNPPSAGQPAPDVRENPRGVAAVGLRRAGPGAEHLPPGFGLPAAGPAWSASAASPACPASAPPNGVIVHHGRPRRLAEARTSVIGRNAESPRSIGRLTARGGIHPGRREELLAGPDQLAGAGPDPLGIAGQHAARPTAHGQAAAPSASARAGANASIPSTRSRRPACRARRPGRDARRPAPWPAPAPPG